MLLPPIATLLEEHPTPESVRSELSEETPPLDTPSLDHTLGTLDTLFEFYHNERNWIQQQRISFHHDDPKLNPGHRSADDAHELPSSFPSSQRPTKKEEPEETSLPCITESPVSSTLRFSQWPWSVQTMDSEFKSSSSIAEKPLQRGLSEPRLIVPSAGYRPRLSIDTTPASLAVSNSATQFARTTAVTMLDTFEDMMEARLESCQRVDKLIRRAHRKSGNVDYGGVIPRTNRSRRTVRFASDLSAHESLSMSIIRLGAKRINADLEFTVYTELPTPRPGCLLIEHIVE
ncbi:hypothetical protein BDP27DRAFT_1413933 [Rhodocollybia butyracea]|uniref:Uncharacterized protein n=1 Tax=Rhodocollybia butyracea TaxID=206335 RepID=A0A9P5UE22_9AGAR|nr:hypothetical protein BDP27DRAFT_1413933 [Rhodocollybia butyracea]